MYFYMASENDYNYVSAIVSNPQHSDNTHIHLVLQHQTKLRFCFLCHRCLRAFALITFLKSHNHIGLDRLHQTKMRNRKGYKSLEVLGFLRFQGFFHVIFSAGTIRFHRFLDDFRRFIWLRYGKIQIFPWV